MSLVANKPVVRIKFVLSRGDIKNTIITASKAVFFVRFEEASVRLIPCRVISKECDDANSSITKISKSFFDVFSLKSPVHCFQKLLAHRRVLVWSTAETSVSRTNAWSLSCR